jgi:hypothetical protein
MPPGHCQSLGDCETHIQWNRTTGTAAEGQLTGKSLTHLPSIVSLRRAWRVFHPNRIELRADGSFLDPSRD